MQTEKIGLIRSIAIGFTILITTVGCSTSDCLDNQNARPVAVFLASGGESTGQQITVDSLTIYGIDAPGGVALEENGKLSTVNLPFRLGENETRYVFEYGGTLKGVCDTLTFRYIPKPEFVSAACGAIYAFDNLESETTTWVIDSVVCPWSKITNVEREYIRIYFRTSDE